jgi:hypothetical protein
MGHIFTHVLKFCDVKAEIGSKQIRAFRPPAEDDKNEVYHVRPRFSMTQIDEDLPALFLNEKMRTTEKMSRCEFTTTEGTESRRLF